MKNKESEIIEPEMIAGNLETRARASIDPNQKYRIQIPGGEIKEYSGKDLINTVDVFSELIETFTRSESEIKGLMEKINKL